MSAVSAIADDDLVARIDALPAQRANAALVLQVCDDPRAGAAELGAAVLSDALLTAKLLRLANSAYFGLSREVTEPTAAIGVLGFGTVRSLALAQLAGAIGPNGSVPRTFWEHGARAGAACGMLAPHLGVPGAEAFSFGLLHDIGRAVLADLGVDVWAWDDDADEVEAEMAAGARHAAVGQRLCEIMKLPEAFGLVIGRHHDPVDVEDDPRRRVLAAALAIVAADPNDDASVGEAVEVARLLGLPAELTRTSMLALDSHASHLVAALT